MGSFKFFCPHCDSKIEADDSWLGIESNCPICKRNILFTPGDTETPEAPGMPDAPDAPDVPDVPEAPVTASGSRINLHRHPKPPPNAKLPEREKLNIKESDPNEVHYTSPAAANPPDGTIASDPDQAPVPGGNILNVMRSDDPSEGPAPARKTSRRPYIFGRAYIRLCVLLVLLLVVLAIFLTVLFAYGLAQERQRSLRKHNIAELNQKLSEAEDSLSNQFNVVLMVLRGSGKVDQDGVLDGFAISRTLKTPPAFLPYCSDVDDVLTVADNLNEYKQQTIVIKSVFTDYFRRILNSLLVPQSGHSQKSKAAKSAPLLPSRIVVKTTANKWQFYADEYTQKRNAAKFLDELQDLRRSYPDHSPMARQSQTAVAGGVFILNNLFQNQELTRVLQGNRTLLPRRQPPSGNMPPVSREDAAKLQLLRMLEKLLDDLSKGWQLDVQIQNVENLQKTLMAAIENYQDECKIALRVFLRQLVSIWTSTLLIGFFLLVGADYLRAHFDMADDLNDLNRKAR